MADVFDWNAFVGATGIAIITVISVIITVITWKIGSDRQTYSNLDTLYQNILQIATDNPKLRVKTITDGYPKGKDFENVEFKSQYDTYALMVWSFYESVCDDAIDLKNMEKMKIKWSDLKKDVNWISYLASFKTDAELHEKWFAEQQNKIIFKEPFQDLVKKLQKKDFDIKKLIESSE